MHTQYLLLMALTLLVRGPGWAQGSSSIEWGRPIVYSDFESRPPKADTAAANISVTILLGYTTAKTGFLEFRVVAVMDKDESWIKEDFKRAHILKHEQGHFDIAQIYAKKLERDLKRKRYTSKDLSVLNGVYDRFLSEMNTLQVRYDRETRGGWDALAQSKWRRFIEGELEKAR